MGCLPVTSNSALSRLAYFVLAISLGCALTVTHAVASAQAGAGVSQDAGVITGQGPGTASLNPDYKNKAAELFNQGLFGESISYWKSSLKRDESRGDTEGQVISLYNMAVAQRAAGLTGRAVRSFQEAWRRGVKVKNSALQVRIKSGLGSALLYSGKVDKSKSLLLEARKDALALGDTELEAHILSDLGNLYAAEGDYDRATGAFEFSALLGEASNSPLTTAKAEINIASIYLQQQKTGDAHTLLLSALKNSEQLPSSYDSIQFTVKMAQAVAKLMQIEIQGQKELVQAMVAAVNKRLEFAATLSSNRPVSQLYGALASIYENAGQLQDAISLSSRAVFEAQKENSIDLLYQWQWQAGRIYRKLGREDDSIRAYRFAVQALQPVRHELSKRSIGFVSQFAETQGDVYMELADGLLNKTTGLPNKRLRTSLLLEARDVVELQKEAELQDYFKDSCVVNVKNSIKHIDDTISSDTAVIYPILLPDRTELLVSYKSGMERYTVNQKEVDVTAEVRALRLRLESRRTRAYLPHAQKLYHWLIQPMEKDLNAQGIKTLVVVADKALRTIPISVLHDGKEFLINKYALATTPGLKLTDPRPLERQNLQVLLSGLSESVQGFPALQHVRGELEEIQDLYVGKLLLNREFISSSVASALRNTNYSVTHIASHSVFSGNVDQSYILTYDDRITVDELGRFAALSRNQDKPIELLTLSSCQTAAGDDRAALGLAGVAIKSGARSALASLWAINDQASALLITEFYRQLRDPAVTKAMALQQAQSKLMKNIRYRHPGYWSPFLLIGNWL